MTSFSNRNAFSNDTVWHQSVNSSGLHVSKSWIICQSILVPPFFITLWVLISMLCFGIKRKKFRIKHEKKENSILFICSFAAVCCAILRFASLQGVLFAPVGEDVNTLCNVFVKTYGVTYTINIFLTYLTLWFRQGFLYLNNSIKHLMPSWLSKLSKASLVVLILWFLYDTIVYAALTEARAFPRGCTGSTHYSVGMILHSLQSLILLSCQILLIFLFIFPLVKHIRRNNKHKRRAEVKKKKTIRECVFITKDPTISSTDVLDGIEIIEDFCSRAEEKDNDNNRSSGLKNNNIRFQDVPTPQVDRSQRKIGFEEIAKHSTGLAFICIVSDLLAYILSVGLIHTNLQRNGIHVLLTLVDTSVSINVVCLIFILKNSKEILLSPMCSISPTKNRDSNVENK